MRFLLPLVLCVLLFPQICFAGPMDDLNEAIVLIKRKGADDLKEARRLLTLLTQHADISEKIKARAYFYLSYCDENEKNLEYARTAINKDKEVSEYYYRYAQILYMMGKYSEAQTYLTEAIHLAHKGGNQQYQYYRLAALCYFSEKDTLHAERNIYKAIELSPNNPELFLQRGKILSDNGKIYKGLAIDDFKRAISLGISGEDRALCYIYVGMLHECDNSTMNDAEEAYRMAYKYTDDKFLQKKLNRKIQSIKSLKKWNF